MWALLMVTGGPVQNWSQTVLLHVCGLYEHCALSVLKSSLSFAADIHALLPIKNNRIVAASNKSSLGECTVISRSNLCKLENIEM